ncbi:MAG TPA: hypothetical protein VGH27_33355 [Streptosporangiaceae bacterium]|jgi:hypothetical protein
MSLALLTGRVPELDCDALGLRPVAEDDVVLVGARDIDPVNHRAARKIAPDRGYEERDGRRPSYPAGGHRGCT